VHRLGFAFFLATTAGGALLTPTAPALAQGGDPNQPLVIVGEPVRLRLVSNPDHLTFHLYEGSSVGWATGLDAAFLMASQQFKPICTAPCEVALRQGVHRMGLSHSRAAVLETVTPVDVRGRGVLVGNYRSRAGVRVGGWVLLLAGNLAGSAMIPIGTVGMISDDFLGSGRAGVAVLSAGAALMLGSLIAALLMVSREDVAWIDFIPD
jgi:hypothetical protein